MKKEEKFFFNHYSLTSDNATNLLATMIEGIKVFYLKKRLENTVFYFYAEMDSFWDFKIDNKLTMREVFFTLEDAYKSFFIQFIEKSIRIENIFENEKILDQLPNYDIVIKNDGSGEQYYLLVLNRDLDGILLSFNNGIWTETLIEVCKIEDNNYMDIKLKNISKKEHAIELLDFEKKIFRKEISEKLPNENIIYSNDFKDWLLSLNVIHRDKTIEKLQFVASQNFEGRRENNIAPISTKRIEQLKEIIVGSAGGISYAQIRVFFKSYSEKYLILNGFIKQNESNQDKKYDEEIEIANKIFKDMKKEIDEI